METLQMEERKPTKALQRLMSQDGSKSVEVVLSIRDLDAMIEAIVASKNHATEKSDCGIFAFRVQACGHADYHGKFRAVGSQTFVTTF